MKKELRIITLNGYFNYGNRLQNYALTKVLESLDFRVKTIWNKSTLEVIKDFIKARVLFFIPKYRAYSKIYRFSKSNMQEVRKNKKDSSSIGYYVVGSDQVWNPRFINKDSTWHFADDISKTISYAASIGAVQLGKEYAEKLRRMLLKYNSISVREESAKKIIEDLDENLDATVVLDPTLLISKEKWSTLASKTNLKRTKGSYILCYILGDNNYRNVIEEFANKHSKKVIYFSDRKDSEYGIEEFLRLIKDAYLICTDSFHACVFSFIFERPFIVFRRTGGSDYMYTRLQNLIDTFKLKNREFNGKEIAKENLKVDYTEAKEILKREQEKSLAFLKKALDINNEK